jgi:hypothetical protein
MRLAFAVALLIPVLAACSGSRCAHVACFQFQVCDPSDGLCKCAGAVCPIGKSCDGTRCVGALGDAGNAGDAGDAGDGGDAGDAGDSGYAGDAGDAGDAGCELPDAGDDCPGVTCPPGTFCSRADALCHCGRRDGRVCTGSAANCEVFLGVDGCLLGFCVIRNPDCTTVSSYCQSPYETCDPETGNCLCGPITDSGTFPPTCGRGFFCGSFDGGTPPQCFQPCDPYAQNCPSLAPPADGGAPDGSIVQSCYYEPWMDALVCEPILNPDGHEGLACDQNSDCSMDQFGNGLACFPLTGDELDAGFVRACRFYCDNFDGGMHICPQAVADPPNVLCVPVAIVDAGGTPIAVGACVPWSR